jgi:hypothetical protein
LQFWLLWLISFVSRIMRWLSFCILITWSRIVQCLDRCVKGKDVLKSFQEEYFLKALSSSEAQWIRRNKGSSTVSWSYDVEACDETCLASPVNNVRSCNIFISSVHFAWFPTASNSDRNVNMSSNFGLNGCNLTYRWSQTSLVTSFNIIWSTKQSANWPIWKTAAWVFLGLV